VARSDSGMASHGRGMAIDDPAVGIELNSCTGLWQCRGVESADTTANQNQPAKSDDAVNAADTFPRQYARTRRFSLGEPRGFQVAPDGRNIAFLRSGSSNDPVNRLYVLERSGQGGWIERCVFDPAAESSTAGDQPLTPEERARRERMRETSSGITSYDVDRDCTKAVFALGGSLHTVSLATAEPLCTLTTPAGPFDPRLSPDGTLVAFVAGGALHIAAANGTPLHGSASWVTVAADDNKDVTWGIADFNAAEEFDRYRGFWWSPDSQAILAARVDNSPVQTWWIADPANPSATPVSHRYPAAGTANAVVTLAVLPVAQMLTGGTSLAQTQPAQAQPVQLTTNGTEDHERWPYLVHASWTEAGCTAVWMNREQTSQTTVDVHPQTGAARTLRTATNEAWIERCPGTPIRLSDNRLLHAETGHLDTATAGAIDPEGTQYLVVANGDGTQRAITPPNLQVRRVVSVTETQVIFTANASQKLLGAHSDLLKVDPGAVSVFSVGLDGTGLTLIAGGADVGVHDVVAISANGAVQLIRSVSTNRTRAEHRVVVEGQTQHMVETLTEIALVNPKPTFFRAGVKALNCVAFVPSPGSPGDRKAKAQGCTTFPILMDPYGGPHAQRVVQARNAHTTSQWFADQGFVVVVVDGRGTPGLGPNFERAVKGDLALGVLEDQIIGLHEAAALIPQADLSRVGIRGWSFGGFLAGLAVLERPEVFHCAVVGAPVTEWRLYDTGYTERYLGNPVDNPEIYDANSLLTRAHKLTRPMMLVHGLADDNVVAANTLQLSSALLAAGKPHEVLPLSGVTHMTPQEAVAENLLLLQVEFLNRHLS
jgi:dipeptidyl-peptidase 4